MQRKPTNAKKQCKAARTKRAETTAQHIAAQKKSIAKATQTRSHKTAQTKHRKAVPTMQHQHIGTNKAVPSGAKECK